MRTVAGIRVRGGPRHLHRQQLQVLRRAGSSLALYLPKIQNVEDAVVWNDLLTTLELHLGLPVGTIKVYVLVEQVEVCFS